MNNQKVTLNLGDLRDDIKPLTDNQALSFQYWNEGSVLLGLNGAAGCGKTYLGVYLALTTMLTRSDIYDNICIIRSAEPTKNQGFLPGTKEEKEAVYESPYEDIVNKLIKSGRKQKFGGNPYNELKENGTIKFESTSYLRGITMDNTIVILDEMQNCSFHELSTVITRLGTDSRLILCGDYYQSDLRGNDKNGIKHFLNVLNTMNSYKSVEFTWEDCVRSSLVKEFLQKSEKYMKTNRV